MSDGGDESARHADAERLAAVGLVAAGVAHEINNALTYVTGNLAFARETVHALVGKLRGASPEEADELVGQIDDALADASSGADRVHSIVRDLRVAARKADEDTRAELEIERPLELAIRLASTELRHKARIVRSYEAVPLVEGSEARLAQVFLQLLLNAAQAIEPSGRHQEIEVVTYADESGFVAVEVRDGGVGIAPGDIPRVFEPYFSTKPGAAGTGLALCRAIVRAHGGEITLDSAFGVGTTFRVALPPAGGVEAPPPVRASGYPAGRRASVLVVSGDPNVGRSARRALSPEHEVIVVGNASDAIAALSQQLFDLVLSEVGMPGMSGVELHARVAAVLPEQSDRFVFVSGGAFDEPTRNAVDSSGRPYVEKPFDPRTLRKLVAAMLRRPQRASGF